MKNQTLFFLNKSLSYSYLFDTKNRENLEFYFSMKNKYGYSFDISELEKIKHHLSTLIGKYEIVVYPETSNIYLNEIASFLSKDVICLEKNSISDIKQFVFSQSFMKNEKAGIINALDSMGSTFKMNKIKANQRKRFVNILFKKINLPSNAKVLFLDDSIFGGYTFLSMVSSVINIQDIKFDSLVLFSK